MYSHMRHIFFHTLLFGMGYFLVFPAHFKFLSTSWNMCTGGNVFWDSVSVPKYSRGELF